MTEAVAEGDRLTLGETVKELGWFPMTYSAVVGAPSILAIIQSAFTQWRLSPTFQWIVDDYSWITTQLAACVEPYIVPAIAWINSVLGWHLVLYPPWRPIFLLLSTSSIALLQGISRMSSLLGRFAGVTILIPQLLVIFGVAVFFGALERPPDFTIVLLAAGLLGALVLLLVDGLLRHDRLYIRVSLYAIGGFVTAAMIAGADQLVKWLG